ncbi:LysR family transcriptional regulator [Rhodobacterales bacterium HKCCE4037]|nr:LysR family transcriptional regulator [Rhodobacterales bacterium HKCCE4037]
MKDLNYRHLLYFREVAREGNLTRAAERMNLSQSALSTQIKTLEDRLGHPLFERVGRGLDLSEVGRIALDYADRIFDTGQELLATLDRSAKVDMPLKVGAPSTLSRNFQIRFLAPVLAGGTSIALRAGEVPTLLAELKSLSLDIVLTTEAPDPAEGLIARQVDTQSVAVHGTPKRMSHPDLRSLLASEPLILPTEPQIRAGFDALTARLDVRPSVIADVDDMAMIRLLAREDAGIAVAPPVVLADEIASGRLVTAPYDLGLSERFYAVTVQRSFPHPVLSRILPRDV